MLTGMVITATKLREDIYRLLDGVLETGEPIEVERNGRTLRITAEAEPIPRSQRLIKRPGVIIGDPEDLVHMDWSSEWRPG